VLRPGEENSWLEITLDEGRNRQIRRLLSGCGVEVLRLIRTAVGPIALGPLGKGQWRHLTAREVATFRPAPVVAEAIVPQSHGEPQAQEKRRALTDAPWNS
jgi:23S rRNA pseudouridine2605 synthase